jgi:hypothetical protein
MSLLADILGEPLTRGLDVDDPRTTKLRIEILRNKAFVHRIYDDWYSMIAARIPAGTGGVLELGSGSGYLAEFIPGVIRSEVFWLCARIRRNAQLAGT